MKYYLGFLNDDAAAAVRSLIRQTGLDVQIVDEFSEPAIATRHATACRRERTVVAAAREQAEERVEQLTEANSVLQIRVHRQEQDLKKLYSDGAAKAATIEKLEETLALERAMGNGLRDQLDSATETLVEARKNLGRYEEAVEKLEKFSAEQREQLASAFEARMDLIHAVKTLANLA